MQSTYHKPLDSSYNKILQETDWFQDVNLENYTTWGGKRISTKDMLNEFGLNLFDNLKIRLHETSTMFITPKNFESDIHYDTTELDITRLNFIIRGEGKMFWYDLPDSIEYLYYIDESKGHLDNNYFYKFKYINKKIILDTWDGKLGDVALCKIITPHSIHTHNYDRVILSIRIRESYEKVRELLTYQLPITCQP